MTVCSRCKRPLRRSALRLDDSLYETDEGDIMCWADLEHIWHDPVDAMVELVKDFAPDEDS